jgi:hypothetical protein
VSVVSDDPKEYGEQDVFAAMCLWECVQDMIRGEMGDVAVDAIMGFMEAKGACQARTNVMRCAPLVETAWCALTEDQQEAVGAYDWEFIPDLVAELLREHGNDWTHAGQHLFIKYARVVATRGLIEQSNRGVPTCIDCSYSRNSRLGLGTSAQQQGGS